MLTSLVSGIPVLAADEFSSDTSKTVCITGHREKGIQPYKGNPLYGNITMNAVKLMLYRYIDMAAEKGYDTFISGLAVGTDLWAAEYILKKRSRNPKIRLIGAMPYLRHAERFPRYYLELLRRVETEADVLVSVNGSPGITYSENKELYRDRNYYMVEKSSAAIAFLNEGSFASGTLQTVNYAYRRGRKVCRFGMKDIFEVMDSAGTDIRAIGREISFLENVFELPY
ncbi:MAG: DUF1273 family protein [Ruminococcus sp.]|nr:DUF1273 family protein [Ruminococcus sp.]MBQ8297285.1 DUF1273 family protein [Ruminococcus sp.]